MINEVTVAKTPKTGGTTPPKAEDTAQTPDTAKATALPKDPAAPEPGKAKAAATTDDSASVKAGGAPAKPAATGSAAAGKATGPTDKVADAAKTSTSKSDAAKSGATGTTPTAKTTEPAGKAADASKASDSQPAAAKTETRPNPTETMPDPKAAPAPPQPAAPQASGSGGFVPALLGGIVAAGIGYGVGWYQYGGGDVTTALGEQDGRIGSIEETLGSLGTQVETLSEGPDLSAQEGQMAEMRDVIGTLTGRVDAVQAEVTGTVGGLTDRIAEIDTRLTDLEQRPTVTEEGVETLASDAIAAYEREVAQLREDMQAQADRLAEMTEAAEADLQAARDDIVAAEQAAAETARTAEVRAALGRIQAAVQTGDSFAAPLADLQAASEVEVPQVLVDAANEGIPSAADLQESYPEAARAALSAVRTEGSDGEAGGLGGFLRSTFNARSVTPREGTDPDAVLSRVGAAVEESRITDALAEAETLPEAARAAMSDWLAAAESRVEAMSAVEDLSQSVNDN